MSQNAVRDAMKTYESTKTAAPIDDSAEQEKEEFRQATMTPVGRPEPTH